jgi:AI-2 transport protein TqsA
MQSDKIIAVSSIIVVIFIGGVVFRLAKPVLFPFCLAVVLSFILSPVLDFMTGLKIPKSVAIVILIILTFIILYLLGSLFYTTGKAFAAEFPKYGLKLTRLLTSLQDRFHLPQLKLESIDWSQQLDLNRVGGVLLSTLGPFFSFLSNLFIIVIFLIFILAGRGKTAEKLRASLDTRRSGKIIGVVKNIISQTQKYLAIKTIISFVTGVVATVILLAFGVDYAVFFGFLTFLLNYIPNIGSIIATAFPVLIALFQFESIWTAVWILLLLVLVQQIIGTFLEPRVMGEGLNLSPLLVIFSLFFWGWLWGLPGMILAVPMAAIIKIICQNVPDFEFIAALMSRD